MSSSKKKTVGIFPADRCLFILGHPLAHTLSPSMHNAALRSLGIPWAYLSLDVLKWELGRAAESLRSLNVQGGNVTVPYKEAIIPFLDQVHQEARRIGTVNTLYKKDGKLVGASTDGEGFLRSLGVWRKKLKSSTGLLIGAGGSAKAVADALAVEGVKVIYVANRTPGRASRLSRLLMKHHPRFQADTISLKETDRVLSKCDWVIQTTSVGLKHEEPSPIPFNRPGRVLFAVDLIYNRDTAFLKKARSLKIPVLNGLGMLLHQGVLSFECWTGRKAPLPIMRRALLDSFVSR